jgi:hypothetical protein
MSETIEEPIAPNDQLIAIVGYSATGKSASLRNIRSKSRWLYLNCESGKRLPFKNNFNSITITDPQEVLDYMQEAIDNPEEVDGIIIDSITFLMEMYESMCVLTSANTMAAWGAYQQYFKTLLQQMVPKFGKPVIFIAHVKDEVDEKNLETKTFIPVKGALKGVGIEAYFSCIVAAKRLSIKDLKDYHNTLLPITEDDEVQGYKHVFQTRLTKKTIGERIRGPMGMFTREQTFIDNDAQLLLDHLHKFYSAEE